MHPVACFATTLDKAAEQQYTCTPSTGCCFAPVGVQAYPWLGSVREPEQVLTCAVTFFSGSALRSQHYYLCNHPHETPLRTLVRAINARWSCEQAQE